MQKTAILSVSWLTHSLSEKTRVVFLEFVNNTDSACFAAKCVGLEFVSTFTFTFELHKNDDSFAVPQPSFHFVPNNYSIGLISGELAGQRMNG